MANGILSTLYLHCSSLTEFTGSYLKVWKPLECMDIDVMLIYDSDIYMIIWRTKRQIKGSTLVSVLAKVHSTFRLEAVCTQTLCSHVSFGIRRLGRDLWLLLNWLTHFKMVDLDWFVDLSERVFSCGSFIRRVSLHLHPVCWPSIYRTSSSISVDRHQNSILFLAAHRCQRSTLDKNCTFHPRWLLCSGIE